MDTHDVSQVGKYLDIVNHQKEALEDAHARRGEIPAEWESRCQTVKGFMLTQLFVNNKAMQGFNSIRSTFITPAYLPSIAALDDLKKITIRELQLETHHRGKYLLLKVVTPPCHLTSIMVVAEDEKDNVITLQLYQQDREGVRPATEILDEGMIVAIKEPYFKVVATNRGQYGVRVDHVSDILKLAKDDKRVPMKWYADLQEADVSPAEWKERGNQAMTHKKYWDAIFSYSAGIAAAVAAEDVAVLKRNRALACIHTQQFDTALSDLDDTTEESEQWETALFRRAQALYGLERYEECVEVLKVLCEKHPTNRTAKVDSIRASDRLAEQRTGKYNFMRMYGSAANSRPPHVGCATHIGAVEVRDSVNRGRGLFTTKEVKAGDLLVCEKAFAYCFDNGEYFTTRSTKSLLVNIETGTVTIGTQGDLIQTIVKKLSRNPSLLPAFTALYHGEYESVPLQQVDGAPVIDSFLVERIVCKNSFGSPLTTRDSHIARFDRKITPLHHTTGVWITASYINHCCFGNCQRSFIGDMQIIRAAQDLPAGTELTFAYKFPDVEGHKHYEATQQGLKKWNFVCDCALCEDAKSTPQDKLEARTTLRGALLACFNDRRAIDVSQLEDILEQIDATYSQPAALVPRFEMWDAGVAVARMHVVVQNHSKAFSTTLLVLRSLGFVLGGGGEVGAERPTKDSKPVEVLKWGLMTDSVVECMAMIFSAFLLVKNAKGLVSALADARIAYRILVGEDDTFDDVYGRHVKAAARAGRMWRST